MNELAPIPADAHPHFPAGVRLVYSQSHGEWVVLAPERIFKADAIAVEILRRCTGRIAFAALIDELAEQYTAPRERILADVTALLRALADKQLMEL